MCRFGTVCVYTTTAGLILSVNSCNYVSSQYIKLLDIYYTHHAVRAITGLISLMYRVYFMVQFALVIVSILIGNSLA
jgi:hypothetical protein